MTDITLLLSRCRAGDAQAIEQLVSTHRPALFRLALSLLDDPAEADEAAQDALVAALRALASFRGEAALGTWLYRITLNVCRGRLRQRRTRERLLSVLQAVFRWNTGAVHPEEAAFRAVADQRLWAALHALPDREREAVILRYYHALPIAEMAQVLNVSERTLHTRLHRAHEQLRSRLSEELEEP